MNKHIRSFLQRGMCFGGFGPIVASVVFYILSLTVEGFSITAGQVFLAVASTYILAFLHAGSSVFHEIDSWPLTKSTFFHLGTLYVAYLLCYIVNSWIPFEPIVILIFTAVFVVFYFIIFITVTLSVNALARKINKRLE